MSKKIFLTGANGFIGKNLVEKLHNKYNFYTPTHDQLDLLNSDSVSKFFQKNGPFDLVMHTAIVGGNRMTGDGEKYAMDSMRMFFNVASCDKYFKRFFYFGSGIEYGREYPIKKFSENHFPQRVPQSNWGLFKYSCAMYAESRPKFVNLRIFGAFGKGEDYRIRFISNAICKYIYNLPIIINQNIKMDYIYIDDLVNVIDQFILKKKLKFNSYNLTPTASIDLVSIANKINRLSTKKVDIDINQKGLSPEYTGDNTRLIRELPSFKFIKIDDAINQLFQWYENNKNIKSKKELSKEYF